MKLFIITVTKSDDDGNLYTDIIYKQSKQDALDELKKIHQETLDEYADYNNYSYDDDNESPEIDDDYQDGHIAFDTYITDDSINRTVCRIHELNI